jgi:hypothetical protein
MRGHLLRDLQPAAVLEIRCDSGRAEGVASDLGLDPGRKRSPTDHSPDIGLKQGIAGQLSRAPPNRGRPNIAVTRGNLSPGHLFVGEEELGSGRLGAEAGRIDGQS